MAGSENHHRDNTAALMTATQSFNRSVYVYVIGSDPSGHCTNHHVQTSTVSSHIPSKKCAGAALATTKNVRKITLDLLSSGTNLYA